MYLMPSLTVFNHKNNYSQGIQHPVLEDRGGEQNRTPIIQEEEVNVPLSHLDTHKSMGSNGIHSKVRREQAEEMDKPLCIIYQKS